MTGDRRRARNRGGYEFAHVCIDGHSRVACVELLADERAETAAGFLRRAVRWFRKRGVSTERVLTDNGGCYRSHDFANACHEPGVFPRKTRPYRPETNGNARTGPPTSARNGSRLG